MDKDSFKEMKEQIMITLKLKILGFINSKLDMGETIKTIDVIDEFKLTPEVAMKFLNELEKEGLIKQV